MLMLANKLKKVKSNQSRFGLKPFSLVTLDYQWKNLYITIGWLGLSTKFVMKMQGYKKSSKAGEVLDLNLPSLNNQNSSYNYCRLESTRCAGTV